MKLQDLDSFQDGWKIKKVLLIEDNPQDASVIKHLLNEVDSSYDLVHRDNLTSGLETALAISPHLILLDLSLPESKGLRTLGVMTKQIVDIPILVLTRVDDQQLGIKAIRLGAEDYLVKNQVDQKNLQQAINHAVQRKRKSLALIQANDRLRRLDRLKSEFISILSHDLRSPVGSMGSAAATLLNGYVGELSEPQRSMIDIIKKNSEFLLMMINDLLDLSRIESGVLVKEFAVMDLCEVARFTVNTFSLTDKSIHLSLPDAPLLLNIDNDRMVQVLQNLLGNATRYATRRIDLTLKTEDDRVLLQIDDDGPGIPIEDLEKIFGRYERSKVHKSKTQTGLGLAIVRAIIDAHGGRVFAKNIVDDNNQIHGARFIISLPLRRVQRDLTDTAQNRPAGELI